jgi:hypothetical protein
MSDERLKQILAENPEFFKMLGPDSTQDFIANWNKPPIDDAAEMEARVRMDTNLLDHPEDLVPLEAIPVLVLPHAFITGGEGGYQVSLVEMLTTAWDSDTHYVQYTSGEDARLRKDMAATNLRFEIMALDLDGVGHQAPSDYAWWSLVQTTGWMSPQPNAVYQTRAGARLVFVVEPITDGLEFEQKRLLLMAAVRAELGKSPYEVDLTKDWTRLLRAPRVVRKNDDGTTSDLRAMPVWVWHTSRLRMQGDRWTVPAAPKPRSDKPRTEQKYTGKDRWIDRYLSTQHEPGARNASLYKVCCWIAKTYLASDAAALTDKVCDHAHAEGLSEIETQSVARSARTAVERERRANVR